MTDVRNRADAFKMARTSGFWAILWIVNFVFASSFSYLMEAKFTPHSRTCGPFFYEDLRGIEEHTWRDDFGCDQGKETWGLYPMNTINSVTQQYHYFLVSVFECEPILVIIFIMATLLISFLTSLLYKKGEYVIRYCRERVETLLKLKAALIKLRSHLRENVDETKILESHIVNDLKRRDIRSG